MAESRELGHVRDRSAQSERIGSVGACGADRLGWGHTGACAAPSHMDMCGVGSGRLVDSGD
jgi:hypothetical protein